MNKCKFGSICNKSFANLLPAKKHLMKAQYNMKLEKRRYSQFISSEGGKYGCKICETKLVHARVHIGNHMKNQHQLKMDEYGEKYEMASSNKIQTRATITNKVDTIRVLTKQNYIMKVPGGTPQLLLVILRPIAKRTSSKRALTRRKLYQPLQVSGDLTPQKLLHPTP